MAALTILTEKNVEIGKGASVTVLSAEVGRSCWSLQLQGEGVAWIKLGGRAEPGQGFKIGRYQIFRGNAELGESVNTWEGPVSVFYSGSTTDQTGKHPQTAVMRVISMK